MVWGWLIAMFFIQCVALSMAELCSSMPTSGGLYYAAAVLAPPGWGPLAACGLLQYLSKRVTQIDIAQGLLDGRIGSLKSQAPRLLIGAWLR